MAPKKETIQVIRDEAAGARDRAWTKRKQAECLCFKPFILKIHQQTYSFHEGRAAAYDHILLNWNSLEKTLPPKKKTLLEEN